MERLNRQSYNLSVGSMSEIIDSVFAKTIKNRESLKNLVINCLSSYDIEQFVEIMNKKTIYKELKLGNWVEVERNSWDLRHETIELDVLQDLGLLTENIKFMGIVTGDTSYGNEFNPYYNTIKVKVYLHDKHKELSIVEKEIKCHELEFLPDSKNKFIKSTNIMKKE
tara:strand:+ start:5341 stop:5841 length:501 start_codon:yes stop_codon:yes gene_type:complete